jgi:hypothetical protein
MSWPEAAVICVGIFVGGKVVMYLLGMLRE